VCGRVTGVWVLSSAVPVLGVWEMDAESRGVNAGSNRACAGHEGGMPVIRGCAGFCEASARSGRESACFVEGGSVATCGRCWRVAVEGGNAEFQGE
jgi:hypothetical protein